jgi:hypothetical protein
VEGAGRRALGEGYFRRREHLRLHDPVLEQAAERSRIAGWGFLGLWLSGWFVGLVVAALCQLLIGQS